MATAEVIKRKPAMVEANRVTGYRPATMDTPAGYVLKLGPRRPASGYPSDMATKTPGAIVKGHTAPGPDRGVHPHRVKLTQSPPDRMGMKGRTIIPLNGRSLGSPLT
jgi:hypothetical protein